MRTMNQRIDELLVQMREMRLTPAELEHAIEHYADHATSARTVIHTAATLLRLEVEFGGKGVQK